jgi:hypothetical protein
LHEILREEIKTPNNLPQEGGFVPVRCWKKHGGERCEESRFVKGR